MKISPLGVFAILLIIGLFFHFAPRFIDDSNVHARSVIELENNDELSETLQSSTAPTFVLFSTSTCPHCLRVIPFFNDSAQRLTSHATFIKVMLGADKRLLETYNIKTVPTLIMFDANHTVIGTLHNSRDITKFLRKLGKYNPHRRPIISFINYTHRLVTSYQS